MYTFQLELFLWPTFYPFLYILQALWLSKWYYNFVLHSSFVPHLMEYAFLQDWTLSHLCIPTIFAIKRFKRRHMYCDWNGILNFFYLPSFASKMSFILQRKYSVELLLYRNQMYTISVSNVSLNGYSIFPFSFRFRFRCCCFLMISLMAKITIAKWCDGIHLNEMTIKIDSNKNNDTNFFRWVVSVIAHTRRDSTNKPQKLCNWSTWMNFGNIFCGGGLQPYYNQ